MLSGAAIKHGPMKLGRVPYAITRIGLQVEQDHPGEAAAKRVQVFAVCACLHMLLAGSVMMESFVLSDGYKGILHALESLKDRDVLDTPTTRALLEKTISHAQDRFTYDMAPAEAWQILFPGS